MKSQLIGIAAAAVILLNACSKNESSKEDYAIKFDGKISQLLATTNPNGSTTNWINGDQIGVFMVNHNTVTIVEGANNRQYNFSGQFAAITGQEIYYPVSDDKVNFISYYPYKPTANLSTNLPVDIADQSDLSKIDYLWAKSTNGTAGFSKTTGSKVPLNFEHVMSKIIIKPVAGNGLANATSDWINMSLKIKGMETKTSLDLSTGTLSSSSSILDITPFTKAAGSSYEAIIIPKTYAAAAAISMTFTIGTDTYVWNNQANETFENGKEYTYTITINKTGAELSQITINDWDTVTRTGTAI